MVKDCSHLLPVPASVPWRTQFSFWSLWKETNLFPVIKIVKWLVTENAQSIVFKPQVVFVWGFQCWEDTVVLFNLFHFLSTVALSKKLTRKPCFPGIPAGPWSPGSPSSPFSPCSPMGPCSPDSPWQCNRKKKTVKLTDMIVCCF